MGWVWMWFGTVTGEVGVLGLMTLLSVSLPHGSAFSYAAVTVGRATSSYRWQLGP